MAETRFSYLSHVECGQCHREYAAGELHGVCGACSAPLLCRYELAALRDALTEPTLLAGRPPTLWRYHELLPVADPAHIVTLGEGMTPLLELPRMADRWAVDTLLMKDEGLLPTATFKARGAAVGISRARELGVSAIAMPSNGNAGGAWALYAARAGMRALITMPLDAPRTARLECLMSGARLHLVDGHIGDAAAALRSLAEQDPEAYFDVSTLREPYRLEGKKTMALEIAEQLRWRAPDVVVYPTGGGVGLIGMYKAFAEMLELGWLRGGMPRFVAVQAEGCAPVVRAFESGEARTRAWDKPSTLAFGINVPKPLGDMLILEALRRSEGTAVAVADSTILEVQREVAGLEGCFVCPEGAAALAAVGSLRSSGWLGPDQTVVVLNTGSGLKYPDLVSTEAAIQPPP